MRRTFAGEIANELPGLGDLGVLARLKLNNSVASSLLELGILVESLLLGVRRMRCRAGQYETKDEFMSNKTLFEKGDANKEVK